MWSKTGKWKPQDYSLHYSYNNISERPTDEEKINFIDNLLNTTLERSNNKGNFSDVRAEIVDHYVSELGDNFHVERGYLFREKVHEYHETFGGYKRINKIATNFYVSKQRIIAKQFHRWFLSFWPVHLAFVPIAYLVYLNSTQMQTGIAVLIVLLMFCVIEGVKYLRDRKVIRQMKSGASAANLFYEYKLLLPWISVNAYYLTGPSGDLSCIFHLMALALIYYCSWAYYYHLKVCQRRVAPLLEEYRSQVISQAKIA